MDTSENILYDEIKKGGHMKKGRKIEFQRKHRILSCFIVLAFFLLMTGLPNLGVVYADEATTTAAGTGTSEAGTEKTSDDESKEVTSNILKDEHGRIVFWEWTKVTTSNYMKLFKRGSSHFSTGTFYPSLLVMHDSNMNPTGFISTYADKDHIFFGPDEITPYSTFDRLGNGDRTKIDAIYKTLDEGTSIQNGFKLTETFKREASSYIVLDSDSQLLNDKKELFSQDSFITSGTSMGVLYFSPVNRGETSLLMGEYLGDNGIRVPRASMQIALSRASAKGNSGDMSYNSIGQNPSSADYFLSTPMDAADNHIILRDHMEELTTIMQGGRGSQLSDDERDWVPKSNESGRHNVGEKVDYSNDITFFGMYAYKGEQNTDKWILLGDDGFSFLAVKNGYLLNLGISVFGNMFDGGLTPKEATAKMVKNYLSATNPSFNHVFSWYIGVPHVFAAVKGEGGDPVTGVGGTTTVGKDEMLILSDASYIDASGNKASSEGVVLPEGSKIVVEEGGVLSVHGNFINNGKIINKGGTIIIKDGGCISPYGTTNEGTIECYSSASGMAGAVIVMPGGKLFSLVDDSRLDIKEKNLAMARVMKGGFRQEDPALLLTGGSNLINYGLFVTNMTRMDNASKIENRKDGSSFVGYNRDSTTVLLYKCNMYNTVGVEHIKWVPDQKRRENSGILATEIYKNQNNNITVETLKGTLYKEPTSNLQLSLPITLLLKRANYVVPEY